MVLKHHERDIEQLKARVKELEKTIKQKPIMIGQILNELEKKKNKSS